MPTTRSVPRALVAAGVLVAATLGGAALADAAEPAPPAIHACRLPYGLLRQVDGPGKCNALERPVTWNVRGEPGPPGPEGPAGPEGPRGPAGSASGGSYLGIRTRAALAKETFTTVVTLELPAGTYLLTGGGTVERLTSNVGSDLLGDCQFGGLPSSRIIFRGTTSSPVSRGTASLPVTRLDLAATGTATLECRHFDFASTVVEAVGFELLAQPVTVQDNG
jgi:hypothetical protein